ncbi:beta-ketoacyl-ACP synthase II [Fulvivirga sedimenti]|uniref:3-oxoacyl-[acyl-carrier-protein] synthase 2 n=1 Tax=Fulvivirga sedimenti TaxID=2879465 RepID=A0A9X1HX31_9BACT|nr:beta-ketoacyl-ACP synthase II [Fulvivirga sedimenti]MCA6078638.1 beta-ketoacyl-ACP synthase II [Fulvivirga sedimenti]
MRRVVITGMGALTPIGASVEAFWENLVNGKSGIGRITRFDASNFPCRIAGEISGWEPEQSFTPREINRKDRLSLYALKAVKEAIDQSGLLSSSYDNERIGVIWASGNAGIETIEDGLLEFAKNPAMVRFSPFYVPKSLLDTPSGEIALEYRFMGINYSVVSACASSNSAIMDALNYIRWNKADVIVAGGSEAPITRALIGGFGAMKALSRNNDNPQGASRPFDRDRDGFVMSEGAGALILESLEHAQQRGAHIIAEVKGAAMSNDAFHATSTHPEGDGAARAMRLALQDADLLPDDIGYINLHATGTRVGDVSEIKAIGQVFINHTPLLSATKSSTGHLLGAAGAIEAVASVMALKEGIVPATINIDHLDESIPAGIPLVRDMPVKAHLKNVMSNTFGFGGHNAIVIFGSSE